MINKYGINYKEIEAEREEYDSGFEDGLILMYLIFMLMGIGAGLFYLIDRILK